MNKPAYIIANINVTNVAQYEQYRILSAQAMVEHGAEILVRGGEQTILEGEFHPRTVILKFPSVQKAREFYDSATYKLARDLRHDASVVNYVMVEGVA